MIKFYKNNKENIDKILMFLIFLFIIFIFFRFVAKYFAPFIFGYILSVLLFPIAEFLHKKFKISKGSCSFIAISILLIFVGSLGTGIVMKIIYEAKAFSNDAPGYVQSVIKNVENLRTFFENRTENLPSWLKTQVSNNFDNIISILTSVLGDGVKSGSMGIFKKIPSVIMTVVFGFISCFFILKDKKEIDAFFLRQLPMSIQKRAKVIRVGIIEAVSGYVRAQCIMMLISGSICAVFLSILGSPYALFLAAVIAVIDALPVFGSGAVFWPWALYSFLNGEYKRAIYLIVVNITVLLARQMLEPRVLGSQIGVNPLVTLTSVYCGLKLFGVLGIVIGPMFVIVVKAMQEAELLPNWK